VAEAWHSAVSDAVVGELLGNGHEQVMIVPIESLDKTVHWTSTMQARRVDDDKCLVALGSAPAPTKGLEILTPAFSASHIDSYEALKGKWVPPEGKTGFADTVQSRTRGHKALADVSQDEVIKLIEELFDGCGELPLSDLIVGVQKSVDCSRAIIVDAVHMVCEQYANKWRLMF
jgi:hypothetical protein